MARGQWTKTSVRVPGFSLIELLVVIAIVVALLAVLIPTVGKARSIADDLVCRTNLRQIGNAVRMYTNDNGDWLPDSYALGDANFRRAPGQRNPADPTSLPETYGIQAVLERYLVKDSKVWICPTASSTTKAYGNTYVNARISMQYGKARTQAGVFYIWDNLGEVPALTGVRGPSTPAAAPEYPHSHMVKKYFDRSRPFATRGSANVLFIDGSIGIAVYSTDQLDPTGPPRQTLHPLD